MSPAADDAPADPPPARLRRLPWRTLAVGALLLAAGLVAALRILPEWQPLEVDRDEAVATATRELSAMGGRLKDARARLRNSVESSEYETAYRLLGADAPRALAKFGGAASWTVTGLLTVPGLGSGNVEVTIARDGRLRRVEWAFGSLFFVNRMSREAEEGLQRFADRVLRRLAGGRPLPAEPTVSQRGNALVKIWDLPPEAGRPPEAVVRVLPGNAYVIVSRQLADPAAEDLVRDKAFRSLTVVIPILVLLGLVVLGFLGRLLFQRRLSFRLALWLGGLAAGTMVLSGSLFETGGSGAGVGAYVVAGRLLVVVALVATWAVAESLLRETVPGFTTSLDGLLSWRVGPRLGNALLAGLGLGAAIAGYRLLFASAAASLGIRGVHPGAPSYYLPLFGGVANPFVEGPMTAGLLILFFALFRFVVAREKADPAGAAVFALVYSTAALFAPWGVTLVYFLGETCVLLYAYRRYGLTALLFAALSTALWRDVLVAARFPGELWVPLLMCVVFLGALAWVGLTAARLPEREDEARIDAPEYVKRLESERRVKYEMDLLSRMQLALLPDQPPEVPGLAIAARTILATEAGGDLYEFVVDEEGHLWVAAGDVSGHGFSCGIQGAMVKACLMSLVRAGGSPAAILGEVDRVLRATKGTRLFTSLALWRLDPRSGRGVLANAGHPFPLLVVEGRAREVAAPGLPLGQGPKRSYQDLPMDLPGGATVVFASDGLFEGPDRFDEPYGYERPRAVLERIGLWRRPAESILEALLADWRGHVGEGSPADDTTLVVVRRIIYS